MKLLDIGCGKGVVLRTASNYPFEKIAGIEIDERLAAIAVKNFQILGLEDRIKCQQADAAEFEGYGDYNVFFLFNPFSDSVMEKVVDKLTEISKKNSLTIIYHNPVYIEIFEQKGKVTIVKRLHDKMKDYDTCIFRLEPKTGS